MGKRRREAEFHSRRERKRGGERDTQGQSERESQKEKCRTGPSKGDRILTEAFLSSVKLNGLPKKFSKQHK